jgi:hypothetical protein
MMALSKDGIRDDLDAGRGSYQERITLVNVEGTDIYLVHSGNHRVLGRQWIGDDTIEAEVTTMRIDLDRAQIKGGIISVRSVRDPSHVHHSALTNADYKVAKALGVREVPMGRSL